MMLILGSTETEKEQPVDLKEMFSLGPSDPSTKFPPRDFPSTPDAFEGAWTKYYDEVNPLANKILGAIALHLKLEDDFLQSFTNHHASGTTHRIIWYF